MKGRLVRREEKSANRRTALRAETEPPRRHPALDGRRSGIAGGCALGEAFGCPVGLWALCPGSGA